MSRTLARILKPIQRYNRRTGLVNPAAEIRHNLWILLFAAAVCVNSFSLDTSIKIGQFVHTVWGEKEGAPLNITAIAQTTDGHLWLASPEGLCRFDGVTFERYQPQSGPKFQGKPSALLTLPNGDLWVGSFGIVSLLRNGRVENYAEPEGVPEGLVLSLVQDAEGTIWAGTTAGLGRFNGRRWEKIGKDWNFTRKSAPALLVDHNGTLWAAAQGEFIVFLLRGTRTFQTTSIHIGQVSQMAEAPNGKLWMAETTKSVRPIPLGGQLSPSDNVEIQVGGSGLLFSREGDLWIITIGDGIRRAQAPEQLRGKIARFSPVAESFTAKDGLTDDWGTCFFQDREGNIWVGTLSGLDRFRRSDLVPVPLPIRYPNPMLAPGNNGDIWAFLGERIFHVAGSIVAEIKNPGGQIALASYRDPAGASWFITTEPALVRFENGHSQRFPLPEEFPKPFITGVKLTRDGSGIFWMAAYTRGLFRRENGIWSRFDAPADLVKLTPLTAFTDGLGRAWFGYAEGAVICLDGGKLHTVFTRQNSPVKKVGVLNGRGRHVWVGGISGLAFIDGDRFYKVGPADLPDFDVVSGIEELADGSLWLHARQGIIRIAAPEVRRFLETPSYRVRYEVFDALGNRSTLSEYSGPRFVEGAGDRIWIAGGHGIAWLKPATIPAGVPPPVLIRSLAAAGQQFAIQPGLTLPPRSESLQVGYTGLNFSSPERVRFRYRLDGVDQDWQEAGIRREAFYTNLRPGRYRFHSTARNEGGEWNATEAVLDFSIAPAWFQTIWFRASCGCAFLVLIWMLFQLRLRQLQRQFTRTLEARVSERTRIARELHDTLLQSFSALLLPLQSASNLIPARPDEAQQRVESAIEQASNAITEGRDAVHQLRSGELPTSDLAGSISNFFAELPEGPEGERRPQLRVQVEGMPRDITPTVRDEAFRIAAEALRNAIRYAAARQIEVEIRYDEQQLRLRIRDDGKGIDPGVLNQSHAAGHWGLHGMRERAKLAGGNFEVWSETGSGTEVELTIPAARAYIQPASRWSILLRGWRS